MRLSGAESVQSQRMGIYTRSDHFFVGGRNVYRRGSPATQYLYYDTHHGWSVSKKIDGSAGVGGPTSAEACPQNASGAWTAWNGSAFSSEHEVQVECMDFAACACERFLVSGAESAQPGKMGYYTRAGAGFNARSVYTRSAQNSSDLDYLFLGSDNWWQVLTLTLTLTPILTRTLTPSPRLSLTLILTLTLTRRRSAAIASGGGTRRLGLAYYP